MEMEIPKFQNVPNDTAFESSGVHWTNKILEIQHVIITSSHHKYHINIKLLPENFQLALYVLFTAYLFWGIFFLDENVWYFFFNAKS